MRDPVGTRCLICDARINRVDATDRYQPCGHSVDENADEAGRQAHLLPRVELGQHLTEGVSR